jgi:rhodanese-related sulfurtransferase
MTRTLTALKPDAVAARLRAGAAVLIDIRDPDEFARAHVKGAVSLPLSGFETAHLKIEPGHDVIFTCRSGMRTGANCDRLAARIEGEAFVLEGGLDGWTQAGLPVALNRKAPLDMMRQVQIIAGLLILVSVGLSMTVHPAFIGLGAFVGAGLLSAGATGFCGMARLLALLPWNRSAAG